MLSVVREDQTCESPNRNCGWPEEEEEVVVGWKECFDLLHLRVWVLKIVPWPF